MLNDVNQSQTRICAEMPQIPRQHVICQGDVECVKDSPQRRESGIQQSMCDACLKGQNGLDAVQHQTSIECGTVLILSLMIATPDLTALRVKPRNECGWFTVFRNGYWKFNIDVSQHSDNSDRPHLECIDFAFHQTRKRYRSAKNGWD